MQNLVEALAFLVLAHPEADHEVDDLEQDEGDDAAVDDGPQDALELDPDLSGVALEQAAAVVIKMAIVIRVEIRRVVDI